MHSDFQNRRRLEKYSSAFTLSDMEIFIFPELFYPLVLSNIMSPVIWKWRDDPWFRDIEKKGFTYKVNRIKQYIIDHYVFNLDLATWGLTTKGQEIARFSDFFDMDMLRQSNALFGYEGDKYYFDIDIRKHFGLDKFNSDVIPYWKTETVEAMGAFRHKEGFSTGAGECVSLSALYASAMFIVGRIPLEKIFLLATPLHSQNFIIEKEGLITNNRRIVTKNMWFNGTSLSEKARRALENEKVTIVSHISGHIHTLYKEATIDRNAYDLFAARLREFLVTDLTKLIFINFLRFKSRYKNMFQYVYQEGGSVRYILLERMFEYEHSSRYNVHESREMLLREIDSDDFHLSPIQGKIILNDLELILEKSSGRSLKEIEAEFHANTDHSHNHLISEMFMEIKDFIITVPNIPDYSQEYHLTEILSITPDDSRDKILTKINRLAKKSEMALLAQYVYRDMDQIDWVPFIKAAIERNPVCFTGLEGKTIDEAYEILGTFPYESIYDHHRLALPDEVWNFRHGDGIEKALLLADFIIHVDKNAEISIDISHKKVVLLHMTRRYHFSSSKQLSQSIDIKGNSYMVNQKNSL
ncbi:MAG TPA: hypothetical protein VHO68_10680 [Bacteroidales bacterium]|nr:hypothetical protein [Bacteroidales bacterium]